MADNETTETIDPETLAQQALCPNCGQPLANHSCPAIVIVSQAAGKVVTRAGTLLRSGRGGLTACGHCGFPHHSHDNARLIVFRCLWTQFSAAELGVVNQYGAEITVEHVQKFGRWWKLNAATVQFSDGGRTGRRAARSPQAQASSPATAIPASGEPVASYSEARAKAGGPILGNPLAEATAPTVVEAAVAPSAEDAVDEVAAQAALRQLRKQRRG